MRFQLQPGSKQDIRNKCAPINPKAALRCQLTRKSGIGAVHDGSFMQQCKDWAQPAYFLMLASTNLFEGKALLHGAAGRRASEDLGRAAQLCSRKCARPLADFPRLGSPTAILFVGRD